MLKLKSISREAIPKALERVERYRLLNEPEEAESICLDILQIDPENQPAVIALLLSLTDQFDRKIPEADLQDLLCRLRGDYERAYYRGIICERKAKVYLKRHARGTGLVTSWLNEAMKWFEQAEAVRPSGNDDAVLRWNSCARIIMERKAPADSERSFEPMLE
ncbi:MAG TPA: hypothetical protein VKA70_08460 [Blastocatellia bacterium]|nr:hypothetical protein [Blastocatellia bacterium]